jgi:hypothetical protein
MCFTCGKLGTFLMQTLQFFTCLFMKFGNRFLTTCLLDCKDILKRNLYELPKTTKRIFILECVHLLIAPKCVSHEVRAQNGGFLVGKDIFLLIAVYILTWNVYWRAFLWWWSIWGVTLSHLHLVLWVKEGGNSTSTESPALIVGCGDRPLPL